MTPASRLMPTLTIPPGVELVPAPPPEHDTIRGSWTVMVDGEEAGVLTFTTSRPEHVLVSAPGWGRRHGTPAVALRDLLAHVGWKP